MPTIQLRTSIPGPKSQEWMRRRQAESFFKRLRLSQHDRADSGLQRGDGRIVHGGLGPSDGLHEAGEIGRGLVVVGRRGQRHENRRASQGGDLGQRRRASAAHDEVSFGHRIGDRIEEGLDPGRHATPFVLRPHHPDIPRARLMNQFDPLRSNQLRRCRHHGHVDRVRALGAAKN